MTLIDARVSPILSVRPFGDKPANPNNTVSTHSSMTPIVVPGAMTSLAGFTREPCKLSEAGECNPLKHAGRGRLVLQCSLLL